MKSRTLLAFAALFLGSAWGSVHGCSSEPAQAQPSTGGGGGGGNGGAAGEMCPPVSCAPPAPALLTSYTELLDTLKSGARVRVVLDYSKCTLNGQPAPNAIGAMNMDTFEWFGPGVVNNPKAYIAASENHLIKLGPEFVFDYVKVRIDEDGKVTVLVQYLDPQSYAVSVDETILCGISDAASERGARFYR